MASGKHTDRVERIIQATPEAIYRALTDPSALETWLPPKGMSGRIERFDLREGGDYRMVLTYDGDDPTARGKSSPSDDVVEGRFVALEPGRRVSQNAVFESDNPEFAGTMTVTWNLLARADGTLVTVTASDVPAGISKADHEAGLASSLDNLSKFLK